MLAKIHMDRLDEIKKTIEEAHEYFEENIQRFEKFMRFIFKTNMTDNEVSALVEVGKPALEFNSSEAFVSRQRGEFAKQQPNLSIRAADGVPISMIDKDFIETMDILEAHFRAIFFDGTNDMFDYNVFTDQLAGGFCVARVYTDYVNEMSFEQNIFVEKVFDSTLTGFDSLARKSHKGDGRFCFEIFPMTRKDFENKYGEKAAEDMKFTRNLAGFDWSYQNDSEKIVLVGDFYEKKIKKETIVKLSNGHTVSEKEYNKFIVKWEEAGIIEQPPAIINKRKTEICTIVRYKLCENKILDYTETDFKYLPLIFFDGNSVVLKEGGAYKQMCRSYIYHAEGMQKLKNFAGQSLASELENSMQHKIMASIESIPVDQIDAYQNLQKQDTLLFNGYLNGDPSVPLVPPQMIARPPIPPEFANTFASADGMMQNILGNYDGAQGAQQSQLSGIAFARSAVQSNNATIPYLVGYIKGLNRVAEIILDLIPKYYKTPRSLPIMLPNGKRSYKEINKKGSLYMNFDANNLQVKVSAGVNFAMQKEIALQTVIALTQANQGFAEFFNQEGLPILLDNIDIRGVDQLKAKAEEWMQNRKQQQQQAQQQQQQQLQQQAQAQAQEQQMNQAMMQKELQSPTDAEVGVMMVEERSKVDAANISLKEKESEIKFIEVLAKVKAEDLRNELKIAQMENEKNRHAVDTVVEFSKHINSDLEGKSNQE